MKQNISLVKRDILEAGRRSYERGYIASNDGNISARIDKKRFLITPTRMSKGSMKSTDLVVVDIEGNVIAGRRKPSSEMYLHLAIYRERPDVNSVCHAHPPFATAFAVAGRSFDSHILPEVVINLGTVPLVPYGTPGTEEFFTPLLPYLKDYDAFLLANHGALTVGTDVISAYHKMETLEHYAHIVFLAQLIGTVNVLDDDKVKKLVALRSKFGARADLAVQGSKDKGR
ncbi:MAG: class II aldolase/adducin family protein [Bacteroidota bacterium]